MIVGDSGVSEEPTLEQLVIEHERVKNKNLLKAEEWAAKGMGLQPNLVLHERLEMLVRSAFPAELPDGTKNPNRVAFELQWENRVAELFAEGDRQSARMKLEVPAGFDMSQLKRPGG